MRSGHSGTAGGPDRGTHWPTAVASLAVGAAFLALWFWLLPPWLGFQVDAAGMARWRWIAVVPSVLGFAVALRCIWDFGWTGHGTPAPFVPPQRLVVVGFYRYVRNPMYVGFFVGWLSLWVVFGRANRSALTVAVVAVLGVALFVRLYEEPTLRMKFGADYDEYCRIPRDPRSEASVPGRCRTTLGLDSCLHFLGSRTTTSSPRSKPSRNSHMRWECRSINCRRKECPELPDLRRKPAEEMGMSRKQIHLWRQFRHLLARMSDADGRLLLALAERMAGR